MPPRRRKGLVFQQRLLGFDKVDFIRHALDRMKQRGITRFEVFDAIDKPDVTGLPTQLGRFRVRRHGTGAKSLDVVYELLPDRVRVITTFRTTPATGSGKPPSILVTKGLKKARKRKKKPRQKKSQRRGKRK